jgi:DNA-binding transcriptional ArsR family regulator
MAAVSWEPFARELRSLREAKGYSSARGFYLAAGGRKFFGATYRQYLNVENGLSGPGPQLVEKIALALQLSSDAERAPGFFRNYLLCVVASQSLLDVILQTLATAPAAGAGLAPMQKALARQSESRAEMLSREQADAIDSSLAAFWLWNLLINDSSRWTAEELAAATRLDKSEVRAALKLLRSNGLIARDAQGRHYCDRLRRVFRFPRDGHYALGRGRHRAYVERIGASGGKDLFRHYTLFRGSAKEVLDYAPNLRAAVEGANICETTEKGADTGLTVVEVIARQLFHY